MKMVEIPGLATLEDIIDFNYKFKEKELPEGSDLATCETSLANVVQQGHADQNQLLRASRNPPSRDLYEAVKRHMRTVAKTDGIDKLFREQDLNLLAFPMDSRMTFVSASSGTFGKSSQRMPCLGLTYEQDIRSPRCLWVS